MNCPNCGTENSSDSRFCISCGSPLSVSEPLVQPEPVIEESVSMPETIDIPETDAPEAEEKTNAVSEALKNVLQQLSPVIEKVKPLLKNKLVLGAIGGAVALVVLIAVLVGIFSGGNGYIDHEQIIVAQSVDGVVQVIVDNKVIDTGIEAEYASIYDVNLDGKVAIFQTSEDELYVVNGKKIKKVAEDIAHAQVSVSGNAIAYLQRDGEVYTLTLYNVKSGKETVISNEVTGRNYAISPDGKSVAYYVDGDENDELMYSAGKVAIRVTAKEAQLLGLSNGGKYIYAISQDSDGKSVLYSYNTKGDREKLGKINDGGIGYSSCVRFNDDHTQVLFNYDGKTYISEKGKAAEKVVSAEVELLKPMNRYGMQDYGEETYPVTSLFDHVYTGIDGNGNRAAWLVKKTSDKTVKLVSKISSAQLDQSAQYLYYIYEGEELRCLKIADGDSANEKCKTIVDEEVDAFVVTSNRSKVYYICDNSLFSVNGKKGGSTKRICSDDVDSQLAISRKDVVYYLYDGDLYACSNGKSGSKVLSDIDYILTAPNGIVYASNSDTLYCTTGSKKLTKLLDID